MKTPIRHVQTPFASQRVRNKSRFPKFKIPLPRAKISWIVVIIGLICLFFITRWSLRGMLMEQVHKAGMILQADEAEVTNRTAKLYELAYSSPVGADKLGLILEANLAGKFQLFSTGGHKLRSRLARRLSGWPLDRCLEIDFSGSPVSDTIFADTGKMPAATWCDLSNTMITDAAIPELVKQAPNLRDLWLRKTAVTGATFAALSQLHHPDELALKLGESHFNDQGMRQLSQSVPDLLLLDISKTKITDHSLPYLVTLTKLESLNLDGTQITPGALIDQLAGLKNLTQLRVEGLNWDTASVQQLLKTCPGLTHLDFGTQLSADPILDALSIPNKITYLGLGDTPLTEANAELLLQLSALHYLETGDKSCRPEIRSKLETNLEGFVESTNSMF